MLGEDCAETQAVAEPVVPAEAEAVPQSVFCPACRAC
jgi:hypothetical protein